ncbi:MAG: diadenylate cyclase CdaA [Marinilabiliaceae bacterium]|nr:diadenylate cyclase CdaA [Marinilabiliaceae bacterium]
MTFLDIRLIDIIDIIIVAFLLFKLYKLMKGTVAVNIFIGIFAFIIFWLIIKSLNMRLSTSILDSVVNVGVIAIIILFQQEIRRLLLLVGNKYNWVQRFSFEKLFESKSSGITSIYIKPIVQACEDLSITKTGALIIVTNKSELHELTGTGEALNAIISKQLLISIFFKNSPLHDGAVIVGQNKIKAAGCILPLSQNMNLPKNYGLRHRAALGISETTDALAIAVSEETGNISAFRNAKGTFNLDSHQLEKMLEDTMK